MLLTVLHPYSSVSGADRIEDPTCSCVHTTMQRYLYILLAIVVFSVGVISFATITGHGSLTVPKFTSSSVDAFTRWDIASSLSNAS